MLLLPETFQKFARYGVLMTASANGDESAGGLFFSFRSIMTNDSWREGRDVTHTSRRLVGRWREAIMREVYK
jgi:hypothetical protein